MAAFRTTSSDIAHHAKSRARLHGGLPVSNGEFPSKVY